MLSLSTINNERVKPVKLNKIDPKNVKGGKLFGELYANIFICAKKRSGKSNLVYNIIKKCADKNTRIVIFSATVNKDQVYKAMIDWLENRGNTVITYTSIKEGGTDNLTNIMEILREPDEVEGGEEESDEGVPFMITDETVKKKRKRKPRKPKYVAPEIIFVLDDLSTELRYPSVANLLKTNRHYKSKVILSSQYIHDAKIESIMQLDYLILFGGHTVDKLELFHKRTDLSLSFEVFLKMYEIATAKRYSFFYIDVRNEEYRVNFNNRFVLESQ